MTSVGELIRLLEEHETAMLTRLHEFEENEQREHAAQLEHFQFSMNKLQKQVEWYEGILQRRKSVEILQVHHHLIARCRGLLNAEKSHIYKPSHVRYQINEEHVKNMRSAVPAVGRVVVSNTNPEQSMTEGTGLKNGNLGSEATIKITTKDFDGNWCYDDMDQIHVQVQSPSGEELNHFIARGVDGAFHVN